MREHDILEIQREARIEAAIRLKIEYPRFRDNLELMCEIKERDKELYGALNLFCTVYMNYFYFAKNLKSEREKLSSIELNRLNQYSDQRDKARQKFIDLLDRSRFQVYL